MINNNYFTENNTMWPGISLSLEVDKILYHKKSTYQDILVFSSKTFWNVLVLDWVIQITQRDESAYQEMLAHIPMFTHKKPETILIIWWWDLWILREALKHESVKKVVLCEIDEKVIEVSKKFFPDLAKEYNNKKANIIIWDWWEYIKKNKEKYDIIIVDSSDPIWPANNLFTKKFYLEIKKHLNVWWILAIQWESLFLHKNIASKLRSIMLKLFKYAYYSQVHVPTYPWWNIWLLICSNTNDTRKPIRKISKKIKKSLKYYSSDIHCSSFILPPSYEI